MALYNEIEPYPAQWLRNLVGSDLIAPGVVAEKSITELTREDLAGRTQVHFFAGIGVWSYALRLAGWPDDREVWTGSCPCQPFSSAGKGLGFADERHLWPAWFKLIREHRPRTIFGEQVASRDGLAWLDAVYADLEAEGYAVAAMDLCAAGFGAPHIRQRLFFVAYDTRARREERGRTPGEERAGSLDDGALRVVADAEAARRRDAEHAGEDCGEARSGARSVRPSRDGASRAVADDDEGRRLVGRGGLPADGDAPRGDDADGRSEDGGVGDAEHAGVRGRPGADARAQARGGRGGDAPRGVGDDLVAAGEAHAWSDVVWIPRSDGKARPTQPGLFPLAHGATSRVGRLRAYGNAIVAPVAAAFVKAFIDTERGDRDG